MSLTLVELVDAAMAVPRTGHAFASERALQCRAGVVARVNPSITRHEFAAVNVQRQQRPLLSGCGQRELKQRAAVIGLAATEYRNVRAQAQLERELVLEIVGAEARPEGIALATDFDRRTGRPAELRSDAPRDGDRLCDARCLGRLVCDVPVGGRRARDRKCQGDNACTVRTDLTVIADPRGAEQFE